MPPNLFAVCPHDTARGFDKWALLNTVVNKNLSLGGRFEAYLDFGTFSRDLAAGKFLWAYVNPADFLSLKDKQGYVPIARPKARYDVAYLVGLDGGVPSTTDGARIAAVPGYLGKLVSHSLRLRGQSFETVVAKSYNDVMTLVRKGEASLGITYNEHFDALAASSSEGFRILERFDAALSHVVVAHPKMDRVQQLALENWLTIEPRSADADRVWAALGLIGFEAVPLGPFDDLRSVLVAGVT